MLTNVDYGRGLHAASGRSIDTAAYEGYIGRWSRPFGPTVLAAAHVAPGNRILDLACGPGDAALLAVPIVAEAGSVVGADISEPMLRAARSRISSRTFKTVVADGQALPFADGTFDAVVCQLGLQFFSDAVRGLEESRRVLAAGRYAAVCVISASDRAPMWGILADTLSTYLPDERDMLFRSFALADPKHLQGLFFTAGFRDVEVRTETCHGTVESFDAYWADVEAGIGMLPQAYLALPEGSRRSVRQHVEARLSKFASTGQLVMSVEMLNRGRAGLIGDDTAARIFRGPHSGRFFWSRR